MCFANSGITSTGTLILPSAVNRYLVSSFSGVFFTWKSEGLRYFAWSFRRGAYVSESIIAPKTLERMSEPELSLPATCLISVENSLSKAFHLWALEVELVGLKVRFLLSV